MYSTQTAALSGRRLAFPGKCTGCVDVCVVCLYVFVSVLQAEIDQAHCPDSLY